MMPSGEDSFLKDIAREAVSQAGFENCETAQAEEACKQLARRLANEVLRFSGLEAAQAALNTFIDEEIEKVARLS
jgi:hypothetical protein